MPSDHMPQEHAQAIGLALRQARETKGENLAEAAFRIALSPSQLRAIESADLTPFYSASYYRQAVDRYAAFLGVSIADIVTSSPAPTETPESDVEISTDTSSAVTAEPSSETRQDAPEVVPSPSQETQEPQTVLAAQDTGSAQDSGSLRERFGSNPEAIQSSEKQRSPLGWIALIAAIVIALGVLKVAMEKPTPSPVAEAPAPVPPPSEPQKATPETTPSATPVTTNNANTPTKPGIPSPAPVAATPTPAAATTVATPAAPPITKAPTIRPAGSPAVQGSDSQLESKATTWVQIVKANGEKSNLKLEPGQKIEFSSADTAAVVFGQPEQASLKVKGRSVNLKPFVTQENPSRALVILNQIRE